MKLYRFLSRHDVDSLASTGRIVVHAAAHASNNSAFDGKEVFFFVPVKGMLFCGYFNSLFDRASAPELIEIEVDDSIVHFSRGRYSGGFDEDFNPVIIDVAEATVKDVTTDMITRRVSTAAVETVVKEHYGADFYEYAQSDDCYVPVEEVFA